MYSKIDSRFWTDEKVMLLSPDARYLMLYLLTCEHRNIIGCYPLPKGYAVEDTGIPDKKLASVWNELIEQNIIAYDDITKIVLVRNFLKYNPIENPSQAKGAITRLERMPRCALYANVIQTLQKTAKNYLKDIINWLIKKLPENDTPSDTPSDTPTPTPCPTPCDTPSDTPSDTPTPTPDSSLQITDNSNVLQEENNKYITTGEPTPADNLKKAIAYFEENITLITPAVAEDISFWCEKFGVDMVCYAIKKGASANAKNFKYSERVLQSWDRKGMKTLQEARLETQQFEERKHKVATVSISETPAERFEREHGEEYKKLKEEWADV